MKNKGLLLLLLLSSLSFSQQTNVDLNRDINLHYENYAHKQNKSFHSSIKPFIYSQIVPYDSSAKDTYQSYLLPDHNPKDAGSIGIQPLVSIQSAFDASQSKAIFESSGGVTLSGFYKNNYSFCFNILAGNSSFVSNVDSFIKQTSVIPGLGSAYSSNLGYSYQNYSGYFSYSPNQVFNFQIGQDKHFFGDGYRSLFLSDIAKNYPFAKITTTIWKIKYVNLFAALKDVTTTTHLKADFKNKYGSFHYLSWNVTKRINFNFFESIIWQGTDTSRARGYDVNYLNPVIFYRPVEYSLGSSDNAFLGFGFKIDAFKNQQFYGQLILDEFLLSEIKARRGWWANKQGFQIGFKNFNLLGIQNFTFQTEFNYVRPYTYSHGSVQQNYGHFNQPLAHPLGANFMESVSFLNYQKKKWIYELKFISAVYGADTNNIDYGKNIFKSYANRPYDYGNKTTQGLKTNLLIGDIRAAYRIIPSMNLKIEGGFSYRIQHSTKETVSVPFVYIGIKTTLGNFYSDY